MSRTSLHAWSLRATMWSQKICRHWKATSPKHKNYYSLVFLLKNSKSVLLEISQQESSHTLSRGKNSPKPKPPQGHDVRYIFKQLYFLKFGCHASNLHPQKNDPSFPWPLSFCPDISTSAYMFPLPLLTAKVPGHQLTDNTEPLHWFWADYSVPNRIKNLTVKRN